MNWHWLKLEDDIAVSSVELPQGCEFGTAEELTVTICNYSCDTVFSGDYVATFSVTGPISTSGALESPGDILPNDCIDYTFTSTADMSDPGTYSVDGIALFTAGSGITDGDITNNFNTGNALDAVTPIAIVEGVTYMESFETDTGGWDRFEGVSGTSGCNTCASGGTPPTPTLWDWGTPSGSTIDTASDGTKAWITDSTGSLSSYSYLYEEAIVSDCYDFSCVINPKITMDIWRDMQGFISSYSYAAVTMEYSTDGKKTWNYVGDVGDGTNWFNNATNNYGLESNTSAPAWTGTSGGWEEASIDADFLVGEPGVHFRFTMGVYYYGSSGYPQGGFAFDNLRIEENYADSTSDNCTAGLTSVTLDKTGSTVYPGEICCETADATEDPSTVPSCWSDGFDNSTYFPIRTSSAIGKRSLNVIMSVDFNAGGGKVQAALYGPFAPGTCPAPADFGAPVRCTESTGPFLAMSGVVVHDSSEIFILVIDGEAGECAAVSIIPFGTALPVELLNFEVAKVGDVSELSWLTASETNNDFFAIERSVDGVNFEEIGTVDGNGTTTSTSYYSFTDQSPVEGVNYYRLRQVDYDGSYEYSDIKWVEFSGSEGAISVFPNPFKNEIQVNMEVAEAGQVELRLTDVVGRVIYSEVLNVTAGGTTVKIELDDRLSKGVYLLDVNGAGYEEVIKVVKED